MYTEEQKLRKVRVGNFILETWDTDRYTRVGKSILGYRFSGALGTLFEGENFGCSPLHAVDSDEVLRGILSFLTLQPGEDEEYHFEEYSESQMAFAEESAEGLAFCYLIEKEAFEDIE